MSVHGRHRGRANIGFADGHARSMAVSLRPVKHLPTWVKADPSTLVNYSSKVRTGDLLNPKYPYGSPFADYYFNLDKPD
jgi:prepilin-type processing-associated H-X9-DG protein